MIIIVAYSVTTEENSPEISFAKEKLLSNLARRNNVNHKVIPADEHVRSSVITDNAEAFGNEEKEDAHSVKPSQTQSSAKKLKKYRSAGKGSSSITSSDLSPARSGNPQVKGGSQVISGGPRTFTVTESGNGETYLLMEAIRLLNAGDIINLKKGSYSLLIGHLSVPDFEIRGEGNESFIELPESLKLKQNLTLKDLKLSNTSTGPAVEIINQKKLILQNTDIQGNGNDCIEVRNGTLVANNIQLQKCNRALLLRTSSAVEGSGFSISDSNYAIFSDSSSLQSVKNLKAESINLYSIYFSRGTSGNVSCVSCDLPDNATNIKRKLILKNEP